MKPLLKKDVVNHTRFRGCSARGESALGDEGSRMMPPGRARDILMVSLTGLGIYWYIRQRRKQQCVSRVSNSAAAERIAHAGMPKSCCDASGDWADVEWGASAPAALLQLSHCPNSRIITVCFLLMIDASSSSALCFTADSSISKVGVNVEGPTPA